MKPEQGPMVSSCSSSGLTKEQSKRLTLLIDRKIEAQRSFDVAQRDLDAAGVEMTNFIYSLEAK
jgi:hypothetical protein